jgi:hypothetical protein
MKKIARDEVLNWLHDKAEPGVPFHYTAVVEATGYTTSTTSKTLYDLSEDSKVPLTKCRDKGMWRFGLFNKLSQMPHPAEPDHPFHDYLTKPPVSNDMGAHVPPPERTTTVLGFTPQGDMVTQDNDGAIRIWIPAEHAHSTYRRGSR